MVAVSKGSYDSSIMIQINDSNMSSSVPASRGVFIATSSSFGGVGVPFNSVSAISSNTGRGGSAGAGCGSFFIKSCNYYYI